MFLIFYCISILTLNGPVFASGAGKFQKIIRYIILYLEVSTVTKKQTSADPLWETSGI